MNDIKVVALDPDGTITQHKQPMCKANEEAMRSLAQRYKLLMVGAGQAMRTSAMITVWAEMMKACIGRIPVSDN